ncbi:MAG: hypothetical protein J6Y04_02900 [Bacteroidaceae bacterium]|nr:hypothetical protein [Bacteroidaceae bacterium]
MNNWKWTMDNGQWTMDNGQWTMDRSNLFACVVYGASNRTRSYACVAKRSKNSLSEAK